MASFLKLLPLRLTVAFAFVSAGFIFYPEIDIQASLLFYDSELGFFWKNSWYERFFFYAVPFFVVFFYPSIIILRVINYFLQKNLLKVDGRNASFLFAVSLIGSGLLCETVMKHTFQRARPRELAMFGGSPHKYKFTPAFVVSNQNSDSFPSGHAAAAFLSVSVAMLASHRRKTAIGFALAFGFLTSIARIMAGAHFLSDVVTSFFVVLIFSQICYRGFRLDERK